MSSKFRDLPFNVVELVSVPGMSEPAPQGGRLAEVTFRRTAWLLDETDRLREMFAADEPLAAIAAALGKTITQVSGRIATLGLRRNSTRPWTDLDDEHLYANYKADPTAEIALILGRSCSAIHARAQCLGLSDPNPPRWSEWEVAQLRAGYEQGIPLAQLSVLIGRPASGLCAKARQIGITHANDDPNWSDDERVECLRLAETGMQYQSIAKALHAAGFPARSKAAVGQLLMKTGYRRGWGRPWTPEEEDSLRAAYARTDSIRRWAFANARTVCSVRWKAGELGLQGTHAKRNGFCGETWTEEELGILRAEYGKTPTGELVKRLGRGRLAICQRAATMGIEHGYIRQFTTDEDRAFHIAFRSPDITFTDLAEAMNRDVAVIGRHAKRLGLVFSQRPHKPPRTPRAQRRTWTLADILALEPMENAHG